MKKIIQLICVGLIIVTASCNKASNEVNPLSILSILSLKGESSLTVKVTYAGPLTVDPGIGKAGTQKINVQLYRSLGATTRDPEPLYIGTTAAATTGTEETITINGIVDGNYYVLVTYDYRSGDYPENQQDPYILYNNTGYPGNASTVAISGNTNLGAITFDDTYRLLIGSAFKSPAGSYTLTMKAQYNGTAGTGDGKIHVYLYNALGDTVTTPYKSAVTNSAAVIGDSYSFAFNGVIPGNYYVLVLYDFSTTGTDTPGLQNDRYIFYNAKQYIDEANTVSIVATDVNMSGTISFGNDYILGAGGTFMSDRGTVTLGVDYTGAETTGYLHVNLYDSLGADTLTPEPAYTWVSDTTVSSVGGTSLVEIPDVHFGNYNMVIYYGSVADTGSVNDPYVLYNDPFTGVQYTGDADPIVVAANAMDLGTVTLSDSYLLESGGTYMTPPIPRTLTVPVRYIGTDGDTGAKYIHVYLYNSLGTSTRSSTPAYTGVTSSAVSVGEDATVTIAGITESNYDMLVFYDFSDDSSGNADSINDRYVLYATAGYTGYISEANPLTINNDITLSRVIFNDKYRLETNGNYMTTAILTVHATYNGTPKSTGLGYIYVYLYGSRPSATRTPASLYQGSTGADVTLNSEYPITISSITPGNYFVLIFYDYYLNTGNPDGRYDYYELYNNTGSSAGASTLNISGYTDLSGIYFISDYQVGASNVLNP
jgi:hypothetical protein